MSTATAERPMVKRNDVSVKMGSDVVEDARIAAAFKGVSLAEYLTETLRPIVSRDIEEGYAKRKGGQAPKAKGGPKS